MPTKPESSPAGPRAEPGAPLVDVRDLSVHFALRGGFLSRMLGREHGSVQAVDGVSFALHRGEVLGLVGESGSGKTTLGRALLHLAPITAGEIVLDGRDVASLSERDFRPLRRRLQMIFQDPHAALNPAMDIGTAVAHPLKIHGLHLDRAATTARVRGVLERVGLTPVEQFLHKYPGDLSGGQKQRAVIARAIILGPDLLVADEPVSMLDMSVRSKILELMIGLQRDLGLTYLYITHDLATAKFFCDRIAIMYLGRIVEIGPAAEIYRHPRHPYTRALLHAIPEPDPTRAVPRDVPRGEVPDAVAPPWGCHFHPRCPAAFAPCGWESRDLRMLLEDRWTRLGEARYAAERPVLGSLDALDTPTTVASVPAGPGHDGQDVVELLEAIREDSGDDPLWKGVAQITADGNRATVRFHEGTDPVLTPVNGSAAACLLYPGADSRTASR